MNDSECVSIKVNKIKSCNIKSDKNNLKNIKSKKIKTCTLSSKNLSSDNANFLNLSSIDGTFFNISSTNLSSTNGTFSNLTVTNIFINNYYFNNSYMYDSFLVNDWVSAGASPIQIQLPKGVYTTLYSTNPSWNTIVSTPDWNKDNSLLKATYTGINTKNIRIDFSICCDFTLLHRVGLYISKYISSTSTIVDLTSPLTLLIKHDAGTNTESFNFSRNCYTSVNNGDYIFIRAYQNEHNNTPSNYLAIDISSYNFLIASF